MVTYFTGFSCSYTFNRTWESCFAFQGIIFITCIKVGFWLRVLFFALGLGLVWLGLPFLRFVTMSVLVAIWCEAVVRLVDILANLTWEPEEALEVGALFFIDPVWWGVAQTLSEGSNQLVIQFEETTHSFWVTRRWPESCQPVDQDQSIKKWTKTLGSLFPLSPFLCSLSSDTSTSESLTGLFFHFCNATGVS